MRVYRAAKLDYGMAHVVCVARMKNLILNVCEESLWQWLEANTTTPMKREWMPWITTGLRGRNVLCLPKYQIGFRVGLCVATDGILDDLVKAAVKSGRVKLR